MEQFINNFISSLLASVSIIIAAFLFRHRIKEIIHKAFYHLIGLGIDGVYQNLNDNDFSEELDWLCRSSSNIKVVTFRGAKSCDFLFKNRNEISDKNVEVIIVNPFNKEGKKWIEEREKEVDEIGYYNMGEREATKSYIDRVKSSVETLSSLGKNIDKFHLYLHNSPAIWSLYIFDNKIGFIGGFTKDKLARLEKFYKLSGENHLLKVIIRQYEYVRDHCSEEYHKSLGIN